MTTVIVMPDQVFSEHISLYDLPNKDNSRVFSILGSTLSESLINHTGRGNGEAIGTINIEEYGIRQVGMADYIRFSNFGELAPSGFTLLVAFRSPPSGVNSGLVNLWSQADKNADSLRRRIYTDGSAGGSGPLRLQSYPSPASDGAARSLLPDSPCVASLVRTGNGVVGYLRLHDQDGNVIAFESLPAQPNPIVYAPDTVLEVGSGSSVSSGGSLIQGVALWSGYMSSAAVKEAAALLAGASGVFE